MATEGLDLRTTLADRTAAVVRQRILNLTPGYQPGARLYPNKLADDLDVSVTPVREALKLLAAEGLVELSPRRGASVVRLSTEELDDIVSVLEGLETMAVRFSGSRFTDEEIAQLELCLDECQRAIEQEDVVAYRAKDAGFHRLLVAGSRNPRLLTLYEIMLKQAQIVELQNPRYPEAMRESLNEHRALVRQLGRGDVNRSEKALFDHWERSRARLRRKYGQFVRGDGAKRG